MLKQPLIPTCYLHAQVQGTNHMEILDKMGLFLSVGFPGPFRTFHLLMPGRT